MRRRDAQPDPETDHGLRELEAALAAEPAADPELALLVADVAAARPEPSAAFLASLDARVHAGFPAPARAPGWTPWHARLRRPAVLVPSFAATLVAALIAVGIATSGGGGSGGGAGDSASSASGSTSSASGSSPAIKQAPQSLVAPTPPAAQRPAIETSSAGVVPKPAPSIPLPQLSSARKVQRAAQLTLQPAPDDVQDTADGVVRATQAAGGYVQQSSVQTRDGGGSASLTLRIPSARLDDTLARLSKLAHVGALNQDAEDITAQTTSAATLLSDARAERQALLRALGKATTARQIASLRARIADNRSTIARRQGDLDAVRRRADLATVEVDVTGTRRAVKHDDGGGAWTPRDALHDAGRVLEVAGGVTVIALAALAPLAILAALALLGARVLRRRRREGALDARA